jgi:hypothetical protein
MYYVFKSYCTNVPFPSDPHYKIRAILRYQLMCCANWGDALREATSDMISRLGIGGVSRLMRRLTTSRLITCFRAGSQSRRTHGMWCKVPPTAKWGRGLADLSRSRALHKTNSPRDLNTHTRQKKPPTNYARGGSFEQGKQQLSNITHAHLTKRAGASRSAQRVSRVSIYLLWRGEKRRLWHLMRLMHFTLSLAHANTADCEKREIIVFKCVLTRFSRNWWASNGLPWLIDITLGFWGRKKMN